MEKELKNQIKKYLKGEPDYNIGLSLLVQASKNKILVSNLSRRNTPRNLKKIQWELRKATGENPFLENPSKKQKKNTGSPSPKADPTPNEGPQIYPETIQKIIETTGKLSSQRDILHRRLKEIPELNTAENISARKVISDQIHEISDHIEHLYSLKDRYFKEKVVPTEDELIFPQQKKSPPKANPGKDPLEGLTDAELVKKMNNIRSNMSKKKNKLNYQSTTRKRELNEMPAGPQRDHILMMIKKDEYLIKQIESRLDGTDKTK